MQRQRAGWCASFSRWAGCGVCVLLMSGTAGAQVLDLAAAWQLALQHDPVYRAAISEQAAAQTERAQGRAELLPQLDAGYYRGRAKGSSIQHDQGEHLRSSLDYDSMSAYVELRQPLLDLGRYARYRRGGARADMGTAVLQARYEAMSLRLAQAYFNVLLAHEGHALQRALVASLTQRARAVERLFQRQEATRIDVQDTRSRLEMARADLIAAADQWTLTLRELQALTGIIPTHLLALRDELPLPPLNPATLEAWLELALHHNAEVAAARQAVRVAGTEVEVATGQYGPTVDLVAAYARAQSENLASLSQKTNTFSVGIRINIPLFAGGYNRAQVARAQADRRRLDQESRAAIERTQAEVTRQFANVQAGADLIQALRTAESSGRTSLASVTRGFAAGVVSNLEVLEVQDRLFRTRHALAKAKLDYVLARLKLIVAAGTHHHSTFQEISAVYFDPAVAVARPDDAGLPAHVYAYRQ